MTGLFPENQRNIKLKGHDDNITCCYLLSSSHLMITGSEDGYAIIWDLKTGFIKKRLFCRSKVEQVLLYFSNDKKLNAITVSYNQIDYNLKLWKLNDDEDEVDPTADLNEPFKSKYTHIYDKLLDIDVISDFYFIVNQSHIQVLVLLDLYNVYFWDLSELEEISELRMYGTNDEFNTFVVVPLKENIIIGKSDGASMYSIQPIKKLISYNCDNNQEIYQLKVLLNDNSSENNLLGISTIDAFIWNIISGSLIKRISCSSDILQACMICTYNNMFIIGCCNDGEIPIWDLASTSSHPQAYTNRQGYQFDTDFHLIEAYKVIHQSMNDIVLVSLHDDDSNSLELTLLTKELLKITTEGKI